MLMGAQEELKGMIQLFRSYDEAMGQLCARVADRLEVPIERRKYVVAQLLAPCTPSSLVIVVAIVTTTFDD